MHCDPRSSILPQGGWVGRRGGQLTSAKGRFRSCPCPTSCQDRPADRAHRIDFLPWKNQPDHVTPSGYQGHPALHLWFSPVRPRPFPRVPGAAVPVRNVELEREERQAIVVRQWVGDAGLEFSGGKKAGNKKTLVLKHVRLQKGYCGMHGGRLEPLPLIRFILSGGKKTPSGYEKDPPFFPITQQTWKELWIWNWGVGGTAVWLSKCLN